MKFDIILCVPGLPFNGKTFDSQSLGGSETAGYQMGCALAKLGHRVQVFCNTRERVSCEDVDYLPLNLFPQVMEFSLHDACIVQRAPQFFTGQSRARFSALWCHDLATMATADAPRGTAWNFDKVFVLSEFQRQQYKSVVGLADDTYFVTRNGVDLELVERVRRENEKVGRNPVSLIYSARPERGLDVLLGEVMPRILQHEPKARLFLSSYDNPVPELADFCAHCDALAARLGNNVVKLGALTKAQLYSVYLTAGVYVYPTPSTLMPAFDEISCISAMEAQACGLPVVSSARGALPETLAPGAGRLISEPMHTPAYYDAFAQATLGLMRSPQAWRAASQAGLERGSTLGWEPVAKAWTDLIEREIRAKSANPKALANHFWRRSDIYAARETLKRVLLDDEATKPVRERIARDWAFLDEPEGFRKQYERIGATHNPAVLEWAAREPRYEAMRAWLKQNCEDVRSVLDYGCAHGAYAVNLLRELPELRVTGVDIDLNGIRMGYAFAEQVGVASRWRGVVGDLDRLTDPDVLEMREQYDCAVAQEVLEHVADPSAVLRALDARVRDGGHVYLTVPFGPWEYSDYRRYPHRAHLWEFDLHDLHDMLDAKGKEADVKINVMPFGRSPETDDALGWWVVRYRVTPETRGKVGAIDMERKLWLQRPRQTVSAAIIAGPDCEDTLHWCLRSLEHVADQVVIADCGLSAEARRVVETYRWPEVDPASPIPQRPQRRLLDIKLITGVDPKTQGFETPRNMALEACAHDWVLWIDTDEKLVQPERLHKYLRENMFQGYSLRQHHFACDTAFEPDMPVRMFRNNGRLRFYGMIHEHPEEALNKGPGTTIVLADVHIPHVGYLIESGRKGRFARNLPMLGADIAKYPERLLQKHFIMRDEMLLATYELQQNGGRISQQIRERARRVVDLWRKHFAGKPHFTNVNPITYYSQAVAMLGEGFDAVLEIATDKVDAKPNGGMLKARFANREDFMLEFTARAEAAAARFSSKYS